MRSGERGLRRRAWLAGVVAALGALGAALPAAAIDNPDTPDFVGEFLARDERAQAAVSAAATPAAARTAAQAYEAFLQAEINGALAQLQRKLGSGSGARRRLDAAEARWLAWRDAESAFITNTWTDAAFGSSAGLSRQAYRHAVMRDRARALWQYLKDQPTG